MAYLRSHSTLRGAVAALAALGFAGPALAHHPLGGETPTTFVHGLLSGIGHPMIGIDHLAFVIAVGIAAMLAGRPLLLPLLFVVATIGGTLVHLAAIGLPGVELVIALSVAAIGAMVLSGKRWGVAPYGALFAVAGLFHGHAYGEAVFGAEATPVAAYLFGFGAIQFAIAVAAGWLMRAPEATAKPIGARLVGAMVAGAGVLLVSEHVLAALGLA